MTTEPMPATESVAPSPKPARGPSLLKAASLIAMVTIFSKLLGFIRDWAVMYVYGTSVVSDAYYAAFQLPAFAIVLLGGLGGPFHTATVAVFSRLIKDQEAPSAHAKRLASTFITLTGIVFTGLSILTFCLAQPIMGLILHGASPTLIQSAAAQLQVMSPCILAGGIVGILYGLSNIYNGFVWPSLSPVAMSVTILAGLWLMPGDSSGMVLAWSTLAGGILQVAMQLPEFFRQKFTFKPAFDWRAKEIRQAGELLFPATIGTTIGQLVTYVDMFFAASLGAGGWSAVTLSNRLVQLPLGVLQTALLVPIFPRFSRAAAEGNFEEIKRTFKVGVISLWLISIPLLVLMMIYTEPLIRLIFQHGKFDARATNLVSLALVYQALQIIPYFARDSITRVFYAFQDSKTPLMVGLLAIFVKALLNWWLVIKLNLGVGGITFAITLVTFINMTLLGVLSKKHIQDLGFKEMVIPFVKLAAAGILMALAIYGVQLGLRITPWQAWMPLRPEILEYMAIALASLAGCAVYGAVVLGLKVSEAQYLQERIGGRFLKRFSK
ncbi:murein biosynthesis integral membrane protein MurJ [Vampirovibrio sp.]|uniref:murein biosynthesis integral membrane protein MurJ n=1 Tax=Vampirovibrio sp. TaxID=2717857 RepID=UPI0035930500